MRRHLPCQVWFVGSVLKVEMAIDTARPKASRFTNKPMTMSCICVVFEQQMV
jgi:hypothetical protein